MLLSGLTHRRQQRELDCLVVCCQMVLTYLGIEKNEAWLWRRLRSGDVTPFPNVEKLAAELGLVVEVAHWGSLDTFGPFLEAGLPVLVAVDADRPSEWPYSRDHAVVVVGFDDDRVYVHDPAQAEAPLAIDIDAFLLAWTARDYEYAVIRLATGP